MNSLSICIDCIDQLSLIDYIFSLLFQISVARSLSKDGFEEGLENAYGIQCSYNGWVADKWIQLKN